MARCSNCGFIFDEESLYDRQQHAVHCRAVERARKKFGDWLMTSHFERERAKRKAWKVLDNPDDSTSLSERVDAAVEILKAWYCRELGASGWNLNNDHFKKWARRFLQREQGWASSFPEDVFRKLVRVYPPIRERKRRCQVR